MVIAAVEKDLSIVKKGRKKNKGADCRVHVRIVKKALILKYMDELRQNSYKGDVITAVAKEFHVARGTITKWPKAAVSIHKQASILEAATVMGVKARRVMGKKNLKITFKEGEDMTPFTTWVRHQLKVRASRRQPITLPWMVRMCQDKIKAMSVMGHVVMTRKREFQASPTWCWRFLILEGFLARRRTCKRNTPVAQGSQSLLCLPCHENEYLIIAGT